LRVGFFAVRRFATFAGFFFFFAFAMAARGFRLWRETLKNDAVSGKLCAMDGATRHC